MSSEAKQVTAEAVLTRIKDEDLESIELLFGAAADHDPAIWRETLRYEMKSSYLMEEILKWDIVIPKLIVHDITTMSPFHFAAVRGADAVLQRFLRLDIPVDMCLQNGSTALHLACFANKPETVTLLVDTYYADINRHDRYGWTALHYASVEGNFAVVEYLIERGVNVGARDKDGTTAAFRAKECGHSDVVVLLESTGVEDQLLVTEDDVTSGEYTDSIYSKPLKPGAQQINGDKVKTSLDSNKQDELSHYERPDLLHLSGTVQHQVYDDGISRSAGDVGKKGVEPRPVLTSTGSGGTPGEDRTAKIRGFISKELQNAFDGEDDAYQRPRTDAEQKEYENFLAGIGTKTLTNVMREEFMKFKRNSLLRPSQQANNVESVGRNIGEDDYDDEIYDQIDLPPTQSAKSPTSPTTPVMSRDDKPAVIPAYAPPLPPPRNCIGSASDIGVNDFQSASLMSKSMVDTSSPEKTKALIIVRRIEHSSAVMDACFKVLSDRMYGDDWKRLAYELPLRKGHEQVEHQIKLIQKRQPNSRSQTLAALTDWRYNYGERANVEELISALNKCGLGGFVGDVERAADDFEA